MKNVTVIGQLHQAGRDILLGHGGLDVVEYTDPAKPVPRDAITRADGLLLRTGELTEDDIRDAVNLAVVSRHGVGCDNVPVAALSARGIPVAVTGPVNAISVAEQTMAMMLALTKRITQYDQAVRTGDWAIRNSLQTAELSGKTLLLLGMGQIGREVARRALAFGLDILVYDPFLAGDAIAAAGARRVEDWKSVLGSVDILSIHLPLTQDTRNIIDAAVLAAMKPNAIILNAARGGLIDEAALFAELSSRMASGGAGLDTFETEPPDLANPLFSLPNVVLSPHSAALTEESFRKMSEVAVRNILAGLEGRLDRALIFNRAMLESEGKDAF